MLKALGLACVVTTVEGQGRPPPRQTGGGIEYVTDDAVGRVDVYETNGIDGYTTYRLSLRLQGDAKNVYTIYGDTTDTNNIHPMSFPPAYQVPAPFGANIGGVADQLIAVHADAKYDSWLSVGLTGGNQAGAISSIDIDWGDWDENVGLTVGDGAVFWMNPDNGPTEATGNPVIAQLTMRTGTPVNAVVNAQGRNELTVNGQNNWDQRQITFTYSSGGGHPVLAPPPPPPDAPPPRASGGGGRGGIEVESMVVRAVVDQVSNSAINPAFPGYTTYRCSLQLMGDARNVYTIYGTEANPMNIPGAFQTPKPIGADVGGVNPAFYAVPTCGIGEGIQGGQGHACKRDSWLTVGLTEGDPSSMLSSIGIDWASWTEMQGVTVDNGAVFWMSPDDGPTPSDADGKGPGLMAGSSVVAQITLQETHQATLKLNAQGRTTAPISSNSAEGNWEELDIVFEMRPGGNVPATPPLAAGNAPATPPPPPSANDCSELQMGLIKRCMENCCDCQSKMDNYNTVIAECVIPGGQSIIPSGAGRQGTQLMASTCGTAGLQDSCPSGQSCNAGSSWKCQCNSGSCAAPNICTAQGACVFQCAAGTEPYSIGSGTCRNCEGNKYSPMGQTCETCAPGREPNPDHTACQPCHDKGAQAWFSPDGGRCQMCSPGSEVDAGRTQCTVCARPQQFSAHGLSCIPCANDGMATAGHTECVPETTRPVPVPPPPPTGPPPPTPPTSTPATCNNGIITGTNCACNVGFSGGGNWISGATYPACSPCNYCNAADNQDVVIKPLPPPLPFNPLLAVAVAVTLDLDVAMIPEGSTARATFEANFKADVARELDIAIARVAITSVSAGSTVVAFTVAADPAGNVVLPVATITRAFSAAGVTIAGARTTTAVTAADISVGGEPPPPTGCAGIQLPSAQNGQYTSAGATATLVCNYGFRVNNPSLATAQCMGTYWQPATAACISTAAPPPTVVVKPPPPLPPPSPPADDDSSGWSWLIWVALLGALGGGGYFAYSKGMLDGLMAKAKGAGGGSGSGGDAGIYNSNNNIGDSDL